MAKQTKQPFQSSPTPGGGRYAQGAPGLGSRPRSFNPRPPRGAGATPIPFDYLRLVYRFQSSPTPGGGRYLSYS